MKKDTSDIFSVSEKDVLEILGKKTMTITEIADKFYTRNSLGADEPIDANNRVAGIVRRINDKCEYHKLPWFLNSMGLGRAGKTVWKDKR